jgi:hypothetical protein
MQNQEIREMLDQVRQMNELARPCWEAIERFASGECICFSIPREMVLAIGARPNEVGNVSADTAYEVYVEGDKIVIGILKDPGDVVCDGNCDSCPIQDTDCDEDCDHCPCKDYCDDCEVASE